MRQAINLKDGYKVGHPFQYPKGTTLVYSTWIPRKTRRDGVDKTVFFGLQYFIKKYLLEEFGDWFNLSEDVAVSRYARRIKNYLGENHGVSFDHIRELHRLGYLPIRIKALPEGARVPYKVCPLTIVNTRPEAYWLVNHLETILSTTLWGPCTSATTAYEYRKLLTHWAEKTGASKDFVPFQGHDFSMRGMFGLEAAEMSGAGHLTSFVGTDTIPAIDFLEEYYGADSDKELIGCSVAATEHSVMCLGTGFYIWDKHEGNWSYQGEAEFELFKHLITVVYPSGIVSVVSDTWNLWRVIHEYLPLLKKEILARDGKLVIRPDSGDPVKILTGYKNTEITHVNGNVHELVDGDDTAYPVAGKMLSQAETTGVVESLWNIFRGTTNAKGYKELDSHIGCIYGDSITVARANSICERLYEKGFASTNWVAGIGSYTYQYVTRDTDGWAMKATYGEVEVRDYERESRTDLEVAFFKRHEIEIFKDPITDDGTKKSARGLIRVDEYVKSDSLGHITHDTYKMEDQVTEAEEERGALRTVFEDGKLLIEWTLQQIRDRLNH